MKNYNVERLDRPAGARGSIATLIWTGISCSVHNNPSNMEALIVRLKLSPGDLTVVNVYHRRPTTSLMTSSATTRSCSLRTTTAPLYWGISTPTVWRRFYGRSWSAAGRTHRITQPRRSEHRCWNVRPSIRRDEPPRRRHGEHQHLTHC